MQGEIITPPIFFENLSEKCIIIQSSSNEIFLPRTKLTQHVFLMDTFMNSQAQKIQDSFKNVWSIELYRACYADYFGEKTFSNLFNKWQ